MDIRRCSKVYMRVFNTVIQLLILFAFTAIYPKLFRTVELSAHDAYLSHKKKLRWTFFFLLFVLLSRGGLETSRAILTLQV